MNGLSELIKNKKFLISAAAISVILIAAVFLIFAFFGNKEKSSIPVVPAASAVPKEKTAEEIINSLTAPVSGEKSAPVSKEILDSLTPPAQINKEPTVDPKTGKAIEIAPTPTPVSKEIIDSLTAPAK
ncbi:MAG: hypothetical protein Q8N37_03495 [bacterium]|nr:hypothetical protein [bacterium]